MKGLRLYKSEKLCSRTAIDRLFARGRGLKAFPLRAVVRLEPRTDADAAPARFLITIPKKKHRKAVARVLLRRRVREAYRLHRRAALHPALEAAGVRADIAFVYLSDSPLSYAEIESRMTALLADIARLAADYKPDDDAKDS